MVLLILKMRKQLITILLLALTSSAYSQLIIVPQKPIRRPYFESASDSSLYEQFIGPGFSNLMMTVGTDKKKVDSLIELRNSLLKRAKGTRSIYEPNPVFTSWNVVKESGQYEQVKLISFSSHKYHKLPRELIRCKNLEAIELMNTNIRRLPGKLKHQSKLHTILVYNNKRNFKIGKNSTLKTLVIRGGKGPKQFSQLKNLERLDLTECKLVSLPKSLHENEKLNELILNENSIDLTKSSKEGNNSITKIELQHNSLTEIPEVIARFPNLKILVLNHNKISQVSPAIGQLSKLEQLSFYNNKLTSIPDGVFNLTALKGIDLYFNQIERIDDRLGHLKSLEVLYLSNNKLISVPESIGLITNLQELYLSNNRLSDLPEAINQLHDLRVLRINNNYLTQVSVDLLKLDKLENIDISSNKITELPVEVASLNHLKILVLVNNPWDSVALERLPSLTEQLRKKEVVVHTD